MRFTSRSRPINNYAESKRKGNGGGEILAHRLRSLIRANRKNEALLVPGNEIIYLIFKSDFIGILKFVSVKP